MIVWIADRCAFARDVPACQVHRRCRHQPGNGASNAPLRYLTLRSGVQIDQFNLRANQQGIAPDEMRAIRVDLTVEPEALGGQKFDLVVVRLSSCTHSSPLTC